MTEDYATRLERLRPAAFPVPAGRRSWLLIIRDLPSHHLSPGGRRNQCCTRHRTASVLPLINRYILNSLLVTRKELHL